ncbi:hypothetical protein EDEG_04023 [Edhazardia aedis USNM 41457]|uniref:Uncharacterized protein n=1 Tax=Edhazardia aedis (strain USNM 41457) TaxID=1003232 RepID=J9DFD9_EDHAE|nr:hypothetical protein EDEG_04023 [Edhazardia aedis USNM 41457]|eukprot:EJW01320.1 hypothetical protein EDEG_04023 [Edhazardia aedis USNM 41457]
MNIYKELLKNMEKIINNRIRNVKYNNMSQFEFHPSCEEFKKCSILKILAFYLNSDKHHSNKDKIFTQYVTDKSISIKEIIMKIVAEFKENCLNQLNVDMISIFKDLQKTDCNKIDLIKKGPEILYVFHTLNVIHNYINLITINNCFVNLSEN